MVSCQRQETLSSSLQDSLEDTQKTGWVMNDSWIFMDKLGLPPLPGRQWQMKGFFGFPEPKKM